MTALAIALGAVLPATATAKPIGPDPSGASFTIPKSRVVRMITPAGGFDWDAGIGAAGALSLSMVVLGGGVAVSQRRGRRTPTA